MNLKNNLFLGCSLFVILSITAQKRMHKKQDLILICLDTLFVAGSSINLEFEGNTVIKYQMYCANSYGSTLIKPQLQGNRISFQVPNHLSNKSGVLNWSVVGTKEKLFGTLNIVPRESPSSIETYIGPPSIEAGGIDYSMLVIIPTDDLDNPLKQNTVVSIQQQFLASERSNLVFTKNLIAFKYIYSPLKSGRILLSSETVGLNSKEYDVNIMPGIATNFTIYSQRNHTYADGNQITTFTSSIIKDKNNNTISDGNFVYFFITNKIGALLKTSGTTIAGVATAKIIHPDYEEDWSIKAYVLGMAESNTLKVKYKKIVENFKVTFLKNNRKITVGPIKSFMDQLMPDGLQVKISIYKNKKFLNEIIKSSREGFVSFELSQSIYKNGNYDFRISTAKVHKLFQTTALW
jgi:hypothetical protein|tara:strand:- start:8338 stop:9555 length:1218 start_codon:yes stop_codon:yes gene_type:complete